MRYKFKHNAAFQGTLAAILLGLCSAIVTAKVKYNDDVPAIIVKYFDLDLARSAGAAALYSRIKTAARQVCEPLVASSLGTSRLGVYRCREDALARAVAEVNASALTSYHLQRTNSPEKFAQQP